MTVATTPAAPPARRTVATRARALVAAAARGAYELRADRSRQQLLAEWIGLGAWVTAGFLAGLIVGFIVLGLILVIVGNIPTTGGR
ncbi:hypothetical protein ACFQE5_04850 [Pseudonocardia hispaniensis]|uniref:Uncharacterized protein n=1 Tax=Pseudonocardia hispaniensis TaxID=904933 RepID=A0ABW1IYU1_9PSEU